MAAIQTINDTILGRNSWPPPGLRDRWEEIERFSALRRSDETKLRMQAWVQYRRPYMISPVPRMISRASANLLFGQRPNFEDDDQDRIDQLVEDNDLPAELHRAAMIASSEGEVWGRIVVDPSLLDVPIIEFVSGARVIPSFSGRFVTGATFVTEWATNATERLRLLESYEAGIVRSKLYRGTTNQLGAEIALDNFEETNGRVEETLTGIEWPLVAFIPNSIDADPSRGYSDYQGLVDRFMALNEASTIGQQNMRLAGQKRAIVDAEYLNTRGELPYGDDVFIRSSRHKGDLQMAQSPLQLIDYNFQGSEVVTWLDHMIDTTLTYAGVAPQLVGRGDLGRMPSGTALKLRAAHSLLEAAGKGRYFDRGVGRLLQAAKIIDSRRTTEGGFGRSYTNPDQAPAIERDTGLPRDDVEAAQELLTLVNAESISLEERVAFLHPDWTAEQITEEVKLIEGERPGAGISTPRPAITLPPGPSITS